MAKSGTLSAEGPTKTKLRLRGMSHQRGLVPSAELVPLQFRMPPDFVRSFKQVALDHDMKLNELLIVCFNEFMKISSEK